MRTLSRYDKVSGPAINKEKRRVIIDQSFPVERRSILAAATGFHTSYSHFQYLRCPLMNVRQNAAIFEPLVRWVGDCLLGWHNRLLLPGGGLTLLCHVLSSIPIYSLTASNLCWLRSIRCSPTSSRNSMVEGGASHNRRGPGFRRLHEMIDALSVKLWWKLRMHDVLWYKFLRLVWGSWFP